MIRSQGRNIQYYLLLIILLAINTALHSQAITFLKNYNSGNSGYAVRQSDANSFVVAGSTDFYYNFHWFTMSNIASTNIQLLKTDLNGNLNWEKIYNLPGYRTLVYWMEPTNDGGFILTGRANMDQVWPPDSNDIILVKTDVDGNIQWSKKYDTGKDELAFCVRQTFDGGYIISGFHDALPVSLGGSTYAILVKTDASGTVQWDKKYQFAVRDLDTAEPLSWLVRQTSDTGYVLTGTIAASHAADVAVIRTDSSGNLRWAKSYEHDASALRFSLGLDIIESLSGDFIIAGSLDKDQSLSLYNYPYILKISSNGTILDRRFYDSAPAQMFQSGFSSVEQTPDGGFFFTGMGGYSGFGMQAQLLKTDVNFNMQWSRAYTNDGAATIGSRSGRRTSDGGYIFTGRKVVSGTVLWKTDQNGFVPCKNPGTLIELIPTIISNSHTPSVISGINTMDIVLTTQLHLIDSSTICPLAFTELPVELVSFSAVETPDHRVQLRWETASETNSDYFLLSKSADGIDFSNFGKSKAAGNTSNKVSYSLMDESPGNSNMMYYRLEQFDFDGTKRVSKDLAISRRKKELELIAVVPDYREQSLHVSINSSAASTVRFALYDMPGKCLLTRETSGKDLQVINLTMQNVSHGIYILTIQDGEQTLTKKINY